MPIPIRDQFGPWRPGLDPGERLARLRSLRALARVILGPRGDDLAGHLHRAETDPAALVPALAALDNLASLDRRKVLTSYAALGQPPARGTSPRARAFPGTASNQDRRRAPPRLRPRVPHRLGHVAGRRAGRRLECLA